MGRILVIGAAGLLGSRLMDVGKGNYEMHGTYKENKMKGSNLHHLDVTKREEVFSLLEKVKPDCVVDTAAITGVDYCETHPEEAWLWFSWLNSREAASRWVQAGQGLRIFPEANNPDYAATPQFRQYMGIARDDIKMGPAQQLLHPEMNEVKQQQITPNIQNVLEGIYSGQVTDYQGALTDLQNRQNAELARAIKDAQDRGVQVDPSWWKVSNWDPTQDYLPGQ